MERTVTRVLTALSTAPTTLDYCHRGCGYVDSTHDHDGIMAARLRHPAGKARTVAERVADRWFPNLDGTAHTEPSNLDTADGAA